MPPKIPVVNYRQVFLLIGRIVLHYQLEVLYMANNMEQHIIMIEGMSCGHCVNAVEKAVRSLPGILSAKVDLGAKQLTVNFNASETTLAQIKEAIEEEGYTVT